MKLQKILSNFQKLHPKEIDLSLDRIKNLCEKLGNPQNKIKAISIVGTNGKNSTIQAAYSILKEANFECNVYTSPHIKKINERFIFSNQELNDHELADLLEEVEKHINLTDFPCARKKALRFVQCQHQALTLFWLGTAVRNNQSGVGCLMINNGSLTNRVSETARGQRDFDKLILEVYELKTGVFLQEFALLEPAGIKTKLPLGNADSQFSQTRKNIFLDDQPLPQDL